LKKRELRQFSEGERIELNEKILNHGLSIEAEKRSLLASAKSLWGFMRNDMSLSSDEREAARNCYDRAGRIGI
jgi:hypothetical protein